MATRHLLRSIALQSLYEWDFKKKEKNLEEILERDIIEFGPGAEEIDFLKKIVSGVLDHWEKINKIIITTAPEWPLEQINLVDRNILRLGIYELLFSDRQEVPPKVAINEAIELAKSFGGENSGKFVNGVLGTIYREIGEPMKEHKKGKKENEDEKLKSI